LAGGFALAGAAGDLPIKDPAGPKIAEALTSVEIAGMPWSQ
jgi:hypothetical protein